MNNHRRGGVQGLVFGGIMAALVVIFAVVPILNLLMPIPLVLTYMRFGGRAALLAGVVSALFSAIFMGPVNMLLILIPGGLMPGMAFGFGLRRGWKPLMTGILALVIFFFGYALTYVGTRALVLGGRDPIADAVETEPVKSWIGEVTTTMEQAYQTQPASPSRDQMINQLRDFREHPAAMEYALLPTILLFMGSVSTWFNYKMLQISLPRLGHPVPTPAPFSEFRLPTWSIWVYAAAALAGNYLGTPTSLLTAPWPVKVAINVISPMMYVFMLAGYAVAYGFIRRRFNFPKLPAALLSMVGMLFGGGMIYVMLAIWDTLFDFRGLGHGLFRLPKPNP